MSAGAALNSSSGRGENGFTARASRWGRCGSTVFLRADYILEPYEGIFIPWEVFFPYLVIGFLALCGLAIVTVIFVNTVLKREKAPTLKFK